MTAIAETVATVTIGAVNVERELGITYRQLDHWSTLGLLRPLHTGGSGNNREWTRAELDVARLMGHLVRAGMRPALAGHLARERRFEIADGTFIEVTA